MLGKKKGYFPKFDKNIGMPSYEPVPKPDVDSLVAALEKTSKKCEEELQGLEYFYKTNKYDPELKKALDKKRESCAKIKSDLYKYDHSRFYQGSPLLTKKSRPPEPLSIPKSNEKPNSIELAELVITRPWFDSKYRIKRGN